MAGDGRTCTECPNPVQGRAKTCSATCRSRRSRRIREARASGRDVPALVTDDAERAAQEVLREEIRPVVKEAITEEVLQGVKELVGAVPAAIAKAVEDLDSTDETIRQRAYALILKHSIGNSNLVPDINEAKQRDLHVYFDLPRPEGPAVIEGEATPLEEPETRTCDSCHQTKPLSQFEANSDRCTECHTKMREEAMGILGKAAVEQLAE